MGSALGDVLGLAAAVAISPLPIIAIIIILGTPSGRLNGLLFTLGWVVGLFVLGAVMLAIGGSAPGSTPSKPAAWVGGLKLGLGVVLVLLGARQWHRRPPSGAEAELPKWMAAIDRFSPAKVLGLGVVLSAANLKNAPLTIAAGASISATALPAGQKIATLALFVIIASLGLLAPLAVFLFTGERAKATLSGWRSWAARHNTAIMAVLFGVLGLKLLGDGIGILVP
ncbi:GAP family protein [Streptosporangium sp. CA-135522]|uniref:GAP family protein n=1 Tax=Streptosporangium sp. CA-135522 TaxID=3240072 RepID=UPI003D92F19C